jgi:F-type H+-transporting ATPase subunit delta
MSLTSGTARRYAEAAFQIAERDDSLEAWRTALAVAQERLSDPDVTRLLANPAVPAATRVVVLGRILGDEVLGPPHSLLALLVRRGRFELLPAVIREFTRLYRRREGIVEATVTSAAPLDATEASALQERLVAMSGKLVVLSQAVDASLLGGVVVQIGDLLIDGSVRGRLARLRSSLVNATI